MWDTAFNVLKVLGSLGAIVTVVMVISRVWSGTAREQLIELLKSELAIAREHVSGGDNTVAHYRQEMHNTRAECEDIRGKALRETEAAKESLKRVEIENADLRARTDLAPVMTVMTAFVTEQREFIHEQTKINSQVLATLEKLLAQPCLNPVD